ncbi:glycerophosphodiester phosphodiesterase family protein [Jannaschia ovalis]|uniref:Glycerophosphodiester phosphodiesterase family protein n=1 Tax=Jannaschia ovalis TaxID=3038773 RepID=A0ABY8LBM3_9RHOB|nr:glycerophosphodiester phosphodiesterase family protein [Jannaschia sp. GRR-S6-38]WGH77450.1 glycerophosphodiester phosphodiesterase family protein [Jannaschia sp. GRR-S6-38]
MSLPPGFLAGPIAHRALHDRAAGRPENSRAAIRAALARGLAIEIDVQISADGVAMVFHDDRLDRLTAVQGPVDARDAAALGRIRLTGGDEGIPTLREVLALVAGRVPLLIEVKDRDGAMGPGIGPLEDAVIADLAGYDGPVAVMSFNPHSVDHIRRHAPHLPRGLVTSAYHAQHWPGLSDATRARLRAMPDLDRIGAQFISHEAADLASPHVARAKAAGLPVLCWTVRSAAQAAEARRIADQVTFEGYLP